jgi:hypothetical protein
MQTTLNAEADEKQSWLEQRRTDALKQCDDLIDHFMRKAHEGKRVFQTFKYSSVILTIIVTVLSAIREIQQWIIPVFSGLAVLTTTMLSATNAQELWLESRSTQQKLTVEKFLFLQDAGVYGNLNEREKVQRFSEHVMRIWSTGHEQWERTTEETE